jgi:gamma-glutamyltranspeptidase/glutathione hydrolase
MTTLRPTIMATRHAVSSGHYLASQAAFDILNSGGNAVDAGVAACICLGVLHSDLVNVAGVAPMMIWLADTGEITTIDGLGTWPEAANVDFFIKHHGGKIPEGLLRTVVPAAPAAWLLALERFGTLSFSDVAAKAIEFARDGFPVFPLFAEFIQDHQAGYARWPENKRIYMPQGRAPRAGELFVQKDLAGTLQYMVDCETAAAGKGRNAGLKAVHEAFYKGDIARTICDYHEAHDGLLTMADMARFQARIERPVKTVFKDIEMYACGAWCQGPSFAQAISMLNEARLDGFEHNDPAYIHHLTETFKLVFADREQYIGDPAFVDVPVDELLNAAYANQRNALIDPARAIPGIAPAGNLIPGVHLQVGQVPAQNVAASVDPHATNPRDLSSPDTSYVSVFDAHGNVFSATPSDTSSDTEVIPGTGLCPSSRGSQSRAITGHPSSVDAGKRPRLTPNPAIALRNGKPLLAFGTPGGDVQIQAMAQVFLNIVHFDMDVQAATEAPRFATYSFPSSFAPNDYHPDLLMLENRIDADTCDRLKQLGHRIDWWPDWTWKAGGVCVIFSDQQTQVLHAGADPRRAGYALGY